MSIGGWVEMAIAEVTGLHMQLEKLLADETTASGLRRTVVETAVIMGFPVAG